MGWFLVLMKLPAGLASPLELGRAATLEPLGTVEDVMARISAVEPNAEWTGPEWGWVRSPTWTIEVHFADKDPDGMIDGVLLSLRGQGDDVVELVFRLADELGCIVFDDSGLKVLSGAEDLGAWHDIQRASEREAAGDEFDANGQPHGDAYEIQRWS
jgi:hypothetical protein